MALVFTLSLCHKDLWVIEDHLLCFYAFDVVQFADHCIVRGVITDHLKQKQAVRRTEFLIGIMQPKPCPNTASGFSQHVLYRVNVFDPVSNMNADDYMFL